MDARDTEEGGASGESIILSISLWPGVWPNRKPRVCTFNLKSKQENTKALHVAVEIFL